jgi:hypothetical protein
MGDTVGVVLLVTSTMSEKERLDIIMALEKGMI